MSEKNSIPRKKGVPRVRAVERAIAILRAFSAAENRLSLSDLARRAGLDKSTARRLLHTLATNELIEFDEQKQTYALGPGILLLVPAVNFGSELRDISAPILARLAEITGATSFLWTYFHGQALCLDRVKARDLHVDTQWSAVGTRIPLNCAGGPRVLLANLPPEERAKVLKGPLPRFTENTQTDPSLLEVAVAEIRRRGWEFAVDDYAHGLSGLGVPVFNRAGELVASISITTLTPQFILDDEGKPRDLPVMLAAAAEIGARLQP
ncbi:IclR family transcriptional regulator [Mesorhizobium sp. J18]|uniref:IclR family transcriptional regulator n=1 Tax=Mesorhizobium sp. J18 TaxID=935263 RepID=UPI00119ACCCE|nr:IclR family transcriptional regulator [Mesorhizobium sp. J18]TWG93490.1 IclR family transcriptional regulator [Mesorhizobium sp. J18]